ncbi:MAG: carboxypeptidase-like regulatory domain-containing protein [Flavobacterium sp.]|nr:carboxypeptidase-like regulatory domain-containing protein [Flavobacterium sp.]
MKKNCFYKLTLLLICQFSFSQNEKTINGTVICNQKPVSGLQITNLVNEKSTITNEDGGFSILAKPDDMLVFTSNGYDYKRKTLELEDFDNKNFIIILTKKIEQLDEVIVSKKRSKSPFDTEYSSVKTYTPAERRLHSARSGLFDPIINAISNRTNQLKKELAVERNEKLLEKIKYLYPDEYYLKKLKIQFDLIAGFQYYAIYDFKLIAAVKDKNKTLINFRMIELAREFNKLQRN